MIQSCTDLGTHLVFCTVNNPMEQTVLLKEWDSNPQKTFIFSLLHEVTGVAEM